jgi:hypothetical protein
VKPVVALAGLAGVCATLVACGGSPPPPPQVAAPKPVAAIPAVVTPKPAVPAASPATGAPAPAAAGPAPAAAAPAPAVAVPAPAGAAPAPMAAAAPSPAANPAPVASAPAPLVPMPTVPMSDAPGYDPKGRRDPFVSLELSGGAKGLQVSTTKLTGIVRSARTTLALVETPDGIGYILKPGDTLGDGRLLEIGADNVVFTVSATPGSISNRVVLKLAAN